MCLFGSTLGLCSCILSIDFSSVSQDTQSLVGFQQLCFFGDEDIDLACQHFNSVLCLRVSAMDYSSLFLFSSDLLNQVLLLCDQLLVMQFHLLDSLTAFLDFLFLLLEHLLVMLLSLTKVFLPCLTFNTISLTSFSDHSTAAVAHSLCGCVLQ
ncbi:hypothetical protein EDD86DRAFT_19151 [Gorgonomyces haynaldii]|nr:hypothetical protein EDD86DRAFT_19151 [Gorgonomyces haynaldii]